MPLDTSITIIGSGKHRDKTSHAWALWTQCMAIDPENLGLITSEKDGVPGGIQSTDHKFQWPAYCQLSFDNKLVTDVLSLKISDDIKIELVSL